MMCLRKSSSNEPIHGTDLCYFIVAVYRIVQAFVSIHRLALFSFMLSAMISRLQGN